MLAECGLAVKDVPELGPATDARASLARMSMPLSERRFTAVSAALAHAADLVPHR